SPSMAGGNRGLWALRVPLEHLGSRVYPDMFSLAQAHQAFDPQGKIANPQLADRLDQTIAGFMDLAEAAKHYPCAKAAWIEFLGEHPDSPIDPVDKPPQSECYTAGGSRGTAPAAAVADRNLSGCCRAWSAPSCPAASPPW